MYFMNLSGYLMYSSLDNESRMLRLSMNFFCHLALMVDDEKAKHHHKRTKPVHQTDVL